MYQKNDAYLFEGLYHYAAIDISKIFNDSITLYPMISVGHGWHFFNHTISLRVGAYIGAGYSVLENHIEDTDHTYFPLVLKLE